MVFQKKVPNLLGTPKNQFVAQALKMSSETKSGNGALKYSTTGNDFLDNFASIAKFKEPREFSEVAKDMHLLWSQNPQLCLKLAVYIRMITRKPKVVNKDEIEVFNVQRGQGLKNEGIMRFLWLAINQPLTFKSNFNYFIAAGSWKDVFQMLSLDLQYHGWEKRELDWKFFNLIISAGLINPETTDLVRKYLPTIRTNKNCKTIESQADTLIGRWLARKLFPDLEKDGACKAYRKLKSEGKAHQWQQLISNQLYTAINFDLVAGKALALLVGSKFLENHKLVDKYTNWIKEKPVAKYTGFVYELFKPLHDNQHIAEHKEFTINAQFAQLIKTGKENANTNSNFLVVRDTSGSMTSTAIGTSVSSFDVAKAMALYFSEFLTGYFTNSFAEFANTCVLKNWKGKTPCDKWVNDNCGAYGGTNFQSVIDMFIDLKENKGVPEQDFPKGILCISDGEFYCCGTNKTTNFNRAIERLREAQFSDDFVSNFKIVLWDIPNCFYGNHETKFEDFADAPNFFYMSGFDPSAITFLIGSEAGKSIPHTAEELFLAAMDQDLLNKLVVITSNKKKKNKRK